MDTSKVWNRNFLLYYISTGLSAFGSYLTSIALAYLILEKTGSTQNFAYTLAIGALASLASPYAGSLVDKLALKPLLAGGDFVRGLALIVLLGFNAAGMFNIHLVYLLVGFNALIGLVYRPAIGKLVPRLVGKSAIMKAYGLMGVLYDSASIFGYLIGGIAIARIGVTNTIIIDAMTFLVMGLTFLAINTEKTFEITDQNENEDGNEEPEFKNTIIGTLKLMVGTGIIVCPLLIFLNYAFLAPFRTEFPRLFESTVFGTFLAFYSLGTLLSGILVSYFGNKLYNYQVLFFCMLVSPLAIFFASFFPSQLTYFVMAFAVGFFSITASTISFSVIQRIIPENMMGKVFGIMGLIENGGLPILYFVLGNITGRLASNVIIRNFSVVFLTVTLGFMLMIRIKNFFQLNSNKTLEVA